MGMPHKEGAVRTQSPHPAGRTRPSTAHSSTAAPRSVAQRSVRKHPLSPRQAASRASAVHAPHQCSRQLRRCSVSRDPWGRCVRCRIPYQQHRLLAPTLERRRTPCHTHRVSFGPAPPMAASGRGVPFVRPHQLPLIDATCSLLAGRRAACRAAFRCRYGT